MSTMTTNMYSAISGAEAVHAYGDEQTQQQEQPYSCKKPPIQVDRHWITKLLKKHPNPNSRSQTKALVVAPMVDQSDLPFRVLCRNYGANLCFTPMIHSRLVLDSKAYQEKFIGKWLSQADNPETSFDRPVIAQLCGSDPDDVLRAAQLIEPHVDGIDINCGCPQGIARRGNYGAFLLEQEETLLVLVKHLIKHLRVPLSVKVRLLPEPEANNHDSGQQQQSFDTPSASLALYGKLVDAGVHLLTIHGRTRKQKQDLTGHADWDTIRRAVDLYGHKIPIFANGSIEDYNDVEECLHSTGCDGIMSSESLLEYPPIFYNHGKSLVPSSPSRPKRTVGRLRLAREYLALAREHPPEKGGQGSGLKCIRVHLHRFLHEDLQNDPAFRQKIVSDKSLSDLEESLDICEAKHKAEGHSIGDETLSWYLRHRTAKLQREQKQKQAAAEASAAKYDTENVDECGDCYYNDYTGGNLFGSSNGGGGDKTNDDAGDY